MFLDELTPVFRELVGHPVAFLGGVVSGFLRLNLSEDPVRSWLDHQSGPRSYSSSSGATNGKNGPKSISID